MGMDFTLVSYNILAQDLLENHSYIYKNHKNDALNWSHRLSKLTDELLLLKPHIICLQEVQHDHLDDIKFNLKELNLKCIYKKKTGIRTDGCAIFYNDSKFVLKDFKSVEFYQPNIEKLDRENVGLIVRLSLKENPEEYIIVATTHLLYNPKRQDVRLAQIQVLLAELDHLSFRGLYKDGIPERFPIILTGDFNLKPCSAPYKLLTRGELEYSNLTRLTLEEPFSEDANLVGKQFLPPHLGITDNCQHIDVVGHSYTKPSRLYSSDNNERSGKISPDLVESCPQLFSSGQLTHSLNLNSAYHHVNKTNEKYASTYQDEWITVDYIFYNKKLGTGTDSNLKLLSRYVLPTVSQCIQMGMIPNNRLGSDHLALAVHFFFKTEKVTS
ncbi:protein angel isoform X2 [Condylostylus longicornis]|nr:protein angel isoform X2 [Condylostylus longicornis]